MSMDRFKMPPAAPGARWVVVSYGDGHGTPQTRDVVALPGETALDAGVALVDQLAAERGYEMHLYGCSEDEPAAAERRAGLLGQTAALHTARPGRVR